MAEESVRAAQRPPSERAAEYLTQLRDCDEKMNARRLGPDEVANVLTYVGMHCPESSAGEFPEAIQDAINNGRYLILMWLAENQRGQPFIN